MADDQEAGFRSERDFMDALRVLKARSGLSYRDIAARMLRTDPADAMAASTLASLLAGNSLPRRPGQVAVLVEVLAAELNEPGQIPRYTQAWSRLIAARSEAQPPAAPAHLAAAARPAAPVWVLPPGPPGAATNSPARNPLSGPQIAGLFFWLALLTVIAFVLWGALPQGVPFWAIWLATIWPLPLAGLISWLGRAGRRRRAGLNGLPAEYLRAEYRDSRPAAGPKVVGHCSR